ncbi:hypothetical protein QFC22_005748 [Naganishia vaughanmartiniae]|uniref:Uncharacterized protein n=1 Tax=Naganishia vaughanmartiniae TaxID=1424756 RepID=A0ACC2WU10_9TREE|nr:hypothetical protein QFC22_005748 [Naganishia vaughanmartiniae]
MADNYIWVTSRDFRDPDGYPLVSTCIIASTATVAAKEEKEQAVRLVAKRWPSTGLVRLGVGGEKGKNPATQGRLQEPLLSSPTLVSFLLTQGYSPYVTTHKGLTPLDLVCDMESRRDVAALLESMMDDDDFNPADGYRDVALQVKNQAEGISPSSESCTHIDLLKFHRSMKARRIAIRTKRIKRKETEQAKDAWLMDKLEGSGMGDGSEFLCWAFEKERKRISNAGQREQGDEELNEEEEDEDEEDGDDYIGMVAGDWSTSRPSNINEQTNHSGIQAFTRPNTNSGHLDIDDSTLLVFSSDTLPDKLYHLIANYPPQAFPLSRRTLPANSIYLLARYAAYRGGDDISAGANLAGLLEMVMLEVERVCMANVESLQYLAFWLYNVTILLLLVQSDETIRTICEEEDLGLMVEEMINALQVHIIRLVETKLDGLIDPALLDHEPADEPQVKFEDEWASTSFFRSLTAAATSKKLRNPVPAVSSIFEDTAFSGTPRSAVPVTPSRSMAGSSNSPRGIPSSPCASTGKTLRRPKSVMDLGVSVTDSLRAALFEETVSPSNVIDILSSTLLILQIYSVNPAFILQIFSQVFVWMAAETFNRIISSVSGKRYQCRSKATQIRLNLEALAEWVRTQSALPDEIYKIQFRRVTQLLQRAIKDYRFEVGEGKLSSECEQHLIALQQDWERRRVKSDIDRIHRQVGIRRSARRSYETADSPDSCAEGRDVDTSEGDDINSIFGPNSGATSYKPPSSPQSASEFEDSRFMLPLAVPQTRYLPAFALDHIYHSMDASIGNGISTFETNSNQLLQYCIRRPQELRRLPDDFLDWLRTVEGQGGSRIPHASISDPRKRNMMTTSVSSRSMLVTAATPERTLPSERLSNHNQTEQSPVSPAYAHHALRSRTDGTAPRSADRPIRLRQLSSGSNGSVNGDPQMALTERSATSGRHRAPEGLTPPESPLRHKSSVGSTALGNLTTQFWPRARQPSDVSVDGYVGSSDDDDNYY